MKMSTQVHMYTNTQLDGLSTCEKICVYGFVCVSRCVSLLACSGTHLNGVGQMYGKCT